MPADRLKVRDAAEDGFEVLEDGEAIWSSPTIVEAVQFVRDRGARLWLDWGRTVIGGDIKPRDFEASFLGSSVGSEPRNRTDPRISIPATAKRVPANINGGTVAIPALMPIHVIPQIRHKTRNIAVLRFMEGPQRSTQGSDFVTVKTHLSRYNGILPIPFLGPIFYRWIIRRLARICTWSAVTLA